MLRDLWLALRSLEMQSHPKPEALVSDQLDPDSITEGNPQVRAMLMTVSPDRRIKSGIWECTAGRFNWVFGFDEVMQVLEGEVHVEADGEVRILTAGSTAFFPDGLVTRWHVPKYVRKFYTHRYPSRPTQLARRVGSALRRVKAWSP